MRVLPLHPRTMIHKPPNCNNPPPSLPIRSTPMHPDALVKPFEQAARGRFLHRGASPKGR